MRQILISIAAVLCAGLAQTGCKRDVPLPDAPPPRIVTFSPALTKLVFDMGLGDHVVGVTSYCRPPGGAERPVVGNALSVRAEPIMAVEPDMVFVQMEVRHFETLRRLAPKIEIEHFKIETIEDVADAMERIGALVGRPELGAKSKADFLARVDAVKKSAEGLPRKRVLFVLGFEKPATPGRGTFTNEMIEIAGGRNVFADDVEGWANPSLEAIVEKAPQVIICQVLPGKAKEAERYWRALGRGQGWPERVVVVTDQDWTLPAAHLAEYTERMAEMIKDGGE